MKTKCFELELNEPTTEAIRCIALCVPCFITLHPLENGYSAEYAICAREEDWPWIERKLAPFV